MGNKWGVMLSGVMIVVVGIGMVVIAVILAVVSVIYRNTACHRIWDDLRREYE